MSSGNQMKNFEWSLKPIILSFLFCGIRLNTSKPQRWIYATGISTLGVALLILNLVFNGITFWHTFSKHVMIGRPVLKTGKINDTASIINSLIGIFIITFLPIGVHLCFVWSSLLTSRLTSIWETLMQIQEEMKLGRIFYQKCRRFCWSVSGLLFLVYQLTRNLRKKYSILNRDQYQRLGQYRSDFLFGTNFGQSEPTHLIVLSQSYDTTYNKCILFFITFVVNQTFEWKL